MLARTCLSADEKYLKHLILIKCAVQSKPGRERAWGADQPIGRSRWARWPLCHGEYWLAI